MCQALAMGNGPMAAPLNMGRCIHIERSQMGSTSFGGDHLVTMITTRPPDEIGIVAAPVAARVLSAACC
jgi:hypothetical protein